MDKMLKLLDRIYTDSFVVYGISGLYLTIVGLSTGVDCFIVNPNTLDRTDLIIIDSVCTVAGAIFTISLLLQLIVAIIIGIKTYKN